MDLKRDILKNLEPAAVFSIFEEMCAIPHGSGHTKAISDWCVAFAGEHGLRCIQDETNNILLFKDASAGYETAAPLILQGHLDMVCAKTADCQKDMTSEGLDLCTDGVDVWADKTSLGGDDGIGVAMILAAMTDESLPHPPLEAVFTVDEETGMDGAFALDCSPLKGRRMLNIDSEEEGVFTVSCAGGVRPDCLLPGKKTPVSGMTGYFLRISGLLGGHSGVEIDRGRANANVLMGRLLYTEDKVCLAALQGGQFDNAICDTCTATVAVPTAAAASFEAAVTKTFADIQNEYATADPGMTLTVEKAAVDSAVDAETSRRMLATLLALPQGVQEMSADFPGLVQTSLNLGVMRLTEDGLLLSYAIRSCIASQKEWLLNRVKAIITLAGGQISTHADYPGWQYAKVSPLRDTVLGAWKDISGSDGRIEATHGGLECGLFSEKLPGLDALSLGPDIPGVHSPNERLNISSTKRVYALLCEVLKRCR